MNVLISYSHLDEEIASKLEKDLKDQNFGIWIDKQSIKPTRLWAKELDDGLREADYVLGIFTDNYIQSTGGTEAYAILGEGLKKKEIKLISLFFVNSNKINSVLFKAFQGIDFSSDYTKGLLELVKFLKSEEPEAAVELLSKIEGEHSANPFRRIRAEYFENDILLAKAFAIPERERYELVKGRTPLFIFGGRGSGKTMVLKSLTPDVIASNLQVKTFKEIKEKGVNYLGIYLRLLRGSFGLVKDETILNLGFLSANVPKEYRLYIDLWNKLKNNDLNEPVISAGISCAQRIFLNEINFKILVAILIKLKDYQSTNLMSIDNDMEQRMATLITQKMSPSITNIRTITDLINYLNCEQSKITDYLQKVTLPYAGNPQVNWLTTSSNFIDNICKLLIDNIVDLKEIKFYLLLDEFENLSPYQQVIINEWVKTSNNIVIKIGAKFEGMHTNMTLQGQPLQFKVGECDEISLDYNLFSDTDFEQYQKLIKRICQNLLTIEGYTETDIQNILESPSSSEMPQETIDDHIRSIIGERFQKEKIKDYRNKLEVAAIFRLLRQKEKVDGRKSRKKIYAGFDTFTYLSSGIIRIFLNLVGMAVYRAEGNGINTKKGQLISIEHQSWAARTVSKGYLEKIHKNIEAYGGINGETLYQFVTDVGDIFLERLLHHSSEPETLSISLKNPHNLDNVSFIRLKNLLCHGVRESIFYKREESSAPGPKHSTNIRSKEYVLNRIYAPALGISHRARWGRCLFSVEELEALLNPMKREKNKKTLQKRQQVSTDDTKQLTIERFE